MRNNIKLININCQSISSKRDKFLALIEDENPDVIAGTESWLTSAHNSGEVFPQQYQVFRKDRLSDAHGGCCPRVESSAPSYSERFFC